MTRSISRSAPQLFAAPLLTVAALAACSSGEDAADTAADADVAASSTTAPTSPAPSATENAPLQDDILALEGLGPLRLGQPLPATGNWAVRGAQISDACLTASSPDYPGIYAIITDGAVRRISVSEDSDVTLVEGIGVGASEADVRAEFGGFQEQPHAYVDAPGKYLTAPNADSGDPALRFEIDTDGNVSLIHVGTMPELGYVEGCA